MAAHAEDPKQLRCRYHLLARGGHYQASGDLERIIQLSKRPPNGQQEQYLNAAVVK